MRCPAKFLAVAMVVAAVLAIMTIGADAGICDGDDLAHVRQDRFLHVHLIRIRPCFQHKDTLQLVAVVHDDGHALRFTGA